MGYYDSMQDIVIRKKPKYQEPEETLEKAINNGPIYVAKEEVIEKPKKVAKDPNKSVGLKIKEKILSFFIEEDQLTVIKSPTGIKSERIAVSAERKEAPKAEKSGGLKFNFGSPTLYLAAVNVFTLVLLCGYIYYDKNKVTSTPRNASESIAGSEIRTYLPGASPITTTSFEEKNYASEAKEGDTKMQAWLTPWNIDQLAENIDNYSSVSAFWVNVNEDGVTLTPKTSWSAWEKFQQLNKSKNNLPTYLTVTGDPNYTSISISTPEKQSQHIKELLKMVNEQKFDGIDIDYEGLGSDNRELFTSFCQNLAKEFHAANKKVAITVEARIAGQYPMDWEKIGAVADEVRIMAYDYHGRNTGYPGPISPLGWIKEILDYAKLNMNLNKVVIGLGNYGYDWQANGTENWVGTGISHTQAVDLAKEKNSPIIRVGGIDQRGYDIGSTPSFTYKDEEGIEHSVWFEDKESLDNKIKLINQYSVKGVIFWSVGLGDKDFWESGKDK